MFDSQEERQTCKKRNGNCPGCPLILDASKRYCRANAHRNEDGSVEWDTDEYKHETLGESTTDITGTFTIHVRKPGTFTGSEESLKKLIEQAIGTDLSFALGWCYSPEVTVKIDSIKTEGGNRPYFHTC